MYQCIKYTLQHKLLTSHANDSETNQIWQAPQYKGMSCLESRNADKTNYIGPCAQYNTAHLVWPIARC